MLRSSARHWGFKKSRHSLRDRGRSLSDAGLCSIADHGLYTLKRKLFIANKGVQGQIQIISSMFFHAVNKIPTTLGRYLLISRLFLSFKRKIFLKFLYDTTGGVAAWCRPWVRWVREGENYAYYAADCYI